MEKAKRIVRATLLLALCLIIAIVGARTYFPFPYRELIRETAAEYDVDPALVAAVIRSESGFRAGVTSSQGARGLMQVMPDTGGWVAQRLQMSQFHPDDLYDPVISIKMGTFYLKDLQTLFHHDLVLVLAAYNAGRQNVRNWLVEKDTSTLSIADIPFAETRSYVEKVLHAYGWYQVLYGWETTVSDPNRRD